MQTSAITPPLGAAGVQIPRLVFGTSALGNLYQSLDDKTKRTIVSQWFEHSGGLVAADSAGKYGAGLALESLAKALTELEVDPSKIVISNKLGWRRVPLETPEPTFEPGVWKDLQYDAVQDISYDGILRCYRQGAEQLAPYRAQLVSVHDPDEYLNAASDESDWKRRWDDLIEAYRALVELRDSGEVAAVGVGSKDWKVSKQLAEVCDLDWVMLATSLTIYTHPPELLEFVETLRQRKVAVINSAVFHGGFLTGGDHFDYRLVTGESESDRRVTLWRDQFFELCQAHGVQPAAACVAFGMSPPGVVAMALNSSRPERIGENVSLMDSAPPAEFWSAMISAGMIERHYPYLNVS